MPRDDLSIDFVRSMPQAETLDPGSILDDWINRVQNLPEEIRFIQDEILDKDRQYNECIRMIDDRDGKIQKWIKTNGSHEPNPKEDALRAQIRDGYQRADQFAQDKISLMQKLQIVMDKHLRSLDLQIKLLYDRAEPGFTEPDEVPSLLRPSAANHAAPSTRTLSHANNSILSKATVASPHNSVPIPANPVMTRLPNHPQIRHAQTQQAFEDQPHQQAVSAPATPAATMILNRQRESSAGPTTKRGPRAGIVTTNVLTTASGAARHSSLGPGTSKSGLCVGTGGPRVSRAGSAGPRTSSIKGNNSSAGRKGTPTSAARKRPPNKSSLSRVKKASNQTSPASTADSDLSDADSISGGEENDVEARSRGTTFAGGKAGGGDDATGDAEEDEDGGDDRKYCLCHNVSYGDMVACDNDNCPYEWFHWSCVGLKSEPNGTWFCPVCTEKLQRRGK